MARLHIAYQNRDREVAQQFAKELGKSHRVTIDVDYLVPGEEWRRMLKEAVDIADGVVVLLSQNSVTPNTNVISSQWIAADIGAARASGKFVIPVVLDDGTRFPALIDDIYTLYPEPGQPLEIELAIAEVNRAVKLHMGRAEANEELFLPSGYEGLAAGVRAFREDASYDRSVFVMMKFPDADTMKDTHCELLADIWDTVSVTLAAHGLKARRADKKAYHDQMWENICIYMLGSKYGIAVLEDRVARELNPNVALEYGFMKALNRRVGLFRDTSFQHDRADLTGKLSNSFKIDAADRLTRTSLKEAVQGWLIDAGVPPIERV